MKTIGARKSRFGEEFFECPYALTATNRLVNSEHRVVGMFDAQKVSMLFKPENRALRALLWLVIILVPGGLFLLALLAADSFQRRYRAVPRVADADLTDVSLSSLGNTSG